MLEPLVRAPIAEAAQTPTEVVSVDDLADQAIAKYHINGPLFKRVIQCESQWNAMAIGDHGASFGLAQIHLIDHPDITEQEAEDPAFALDWMAKVWSEHQQNQWSCYRIVTTMK